MHVGVVKTICAEPNHSALDQSCELLLGVARPCQRESRTDGLVGGPRSVGQQVDLALRLDDANAFENVTCIEEARATGVLGVPRSRISAPTKSSV